MYLGGSERERVMLDHVALVKTFVSQETCKRCTAERTRPSDIDERGGGSDYMNGEEQHYCSTADAKVENDTMGSKDKSLEAEREPG